jgi:hypothetical protein
MKWTNSYKRIGLIVMWIASLLLASEWGHTQIQIIQRPAAGEHVISGNDLGFRFEGRIGETVIGTLVVRVNGQWVPAESADKMKHLVDK